MNPALDTLAPTRPLPVPSELTEPFWAAAREERLLIPFCPARDLWFFPPELRTPGFPDDPWEWREASGRGTLYSCTEVHRAPVPGFVTPYLLSIVLLEEGASLLTHLVDVPDGDHGNG